MDKDAGAGGNHINLYIHISDTIIWHIEDAAKPSDFQISAQWRMHKLSQECPEKIQIGGGASGTFTSTSIGLGKYGDWDTSNMICYKVGTVCVAQVKVGEVTLDLTDFLMRAGALQ